MNGFYSEYVYDTAEMVLGFIALVLPFVAIPVMLA